MKISRFTVFVKVFSLESFVGHYNVILVCVSQRFIIITDPCCELCSIVILQVYVVLCILMSVPLFIDLCLLLFLAWCSSQAACSEGDPVSPPSSLEAGEERLQMLEDHWPRCFWWGGPCTEARHGTCVCYEDTEKVRHAGKGTSELWLIMMKVYMYCS